MATQALQRALAEHPFIGDVRAEHLDYLARCTRTERFSDRQTLLREGSSAERLFLIRSGRVALEMHVAGRGPTVVETLGPGDVIGWSALFEPYLWSVTARVVDSSQVFVLEAEGLRGKIAADPEFGCYMMRQLLLVIHRRLERARLQPVDVFRVHP